MAYVKIEEVLETARNGYHTDFGRSMADLTSLREVLEDAPTADVVEAKHGEWLDVQYTYFGLKRYVCSQCSDDEYWEKRYLEHKESFCPNCGARMDGERK